jgi:hypothetical protein
MDTLGALRQQQYAREVAAENASRNGVQFQIVHTTGQGPLMYPTPVMFPSLFLEKPFVTYGFVIPDGVQLAKGDAPICSGGVRSWVTGAPRQDGRVFYAGCYLLINVTTTGSYPIEHHFRFEGLTLKAVPTELST